VYARHWVCAPSLAAALRWYSAEHGMSITEATDTDVRDISLGINLPFNDKGEPWPLWFHIADHFRVALRDHPAGTPLPADFFDPFIIATTEDETE
jgi:hypothetical protein